MSSFVLGISWKMEKGGRFLFSHGILPAVVDSSKAVHAVAHENLGCRRDIGESIRRPKRHGKDLPTVRKPMAVLRAFFALLILDRVAVFVR